MSILNNAVLSIQVGLEDLQLSTPGRALSCVRNLHSGVLLLLKTRLLELSPEGSDEVLLKQKIQPTQNRDGKLNFKGAGKKTVDVDEIKRRLTSMGVALDWNRIKRLTKERNNIEHYYAKVSNDAIRALAADVLLIVRDFTLNHLKREPLELFGNAAWKLLLENEEVFAQERAECQEKLHGIAWGSCALSEAVEALQCTTCASLLLIPHGPEESVQEIRLNCKSCGATIGPNGLIAAALESYFFDEMYTSAREGLDESPLATCPACMQETYVINEQACAYCSYERDFTECSQCGDSIGVGYQHFDGLCSWCDHRNGKDDKFVES